jgi:hypothetical protein
MEGPEHAGDGEAGRGAKTASSRRSASWPIADQPAMCPVHMSGRRKRDRATETRELRRASMKPSYDEKMRKKSYSVFSDYFSSTITDCIRDLRAKAAKLAAK